MEEKNDCISCPQDKCEYNKIGIGLGCRECEECGCNPNFIDNNCNRCLKCASKEGELRWSNNFLDIFSQEENKINVIEIK